MHLFLAHNEGVFKTYSPSSNFQLLIECTISYYHSYCSFSTVNATEVLYVFRNIQSKNFELDDGLAHLHWKCMQILMSGISHVCLILAKNK